MTDLGVQNADQFDILIVDDTPTSLDLLCRILGDRGYRVRPACNGRLALRSAVARPPDLILLDVKMPEMDGYEVCRRLKSNDQSRNVPVLFISAHGETGNRVEGFKAGGVDFISKPFEREDVLARVELHLRLHELTERLEEQVAERTQELQQEIAERARAEKTLQEKDYIIESASSVIATCDLQGVMTYVNPAFLRTWGFEAVDEIYGRPFWEFWLVEDRLDEIMTALMSEGTWSGEIEAKKKDGAIFFVHAFAATVLNKAGEPVALMSTSMDITERKQVELLLNLRVTLMGYAATHSLEELLVKALDEVEEVTLSRISFFHFVNPDQRTLSLEAWSTRTASEFCTAEGKGLHYSLDEAGVWADCVRQRRAVIHNDYESLAHRKGTPPGHAAVTRELVVPIFRGDNIVAILGVGNKPHDYTQEDAQLVGYCADIAWEMAERKRAEEHLKQHHDFLEAEVKKRTSELAAAKEQAEAANAAKSDFLARMSHELRTPLNAILGYAQMLLRRQVDADLGKGLTTIHQSGEHLLTLINDILDTAKIEMGRVELSPLPIHLGAFLETILGLIRSRAEAKGLSARLERPATLPDAVVVDGTRLRQVLLNLLNNAVKFTDAGDVVLRVTCHDTVPTAAQPSPGVRLQFEVVDTGIGIAADQLARIFTPFEQASEPVRRTEGTGLGLFISRQLVALMGGELTVESELGRGSTFRFEIAVPKTSVPTEAGAADDQVITGYSGPRRRVLVVDDIDSNRAMLADMLRHVGFEVAEAADGRQAVASAQENPPDLILMDRRMPEMDGLAAMQWIRRIPRLARVPAIAISASVAKGDRAHMLQMGFNGFAPKPVVWPRLATLLQTHLNLEWQYGPKKETGEERTLDTQPLTPPPGEELEILHDLVLMGDMKGIVSRAAHINSLGDQYSPFAQRLRQLAETFETEQIRLLVQRCMEKDL